MISNAQNRTATVVEMIDDQVSVRRLKGNVIANANHPTKEAAVDQLWRVPVGPADWLVGSVCKALRSPLDIESTQRVLSDPRVCQSRINIMAVVFDSSDNRMTPSTSKRRAAGGPYVSYLLFPGDNAEQ